jgi:pyruvate,water dikinase
MINANWGLGESIVGGTATPDTFVVSKRGPAIVWRDIAVKERMTVLTSSGTHDADVPAERRAEPSIGDAQVLEIAQLAVALEGATGSPVDVECAIAEDVLHLLQCRPITTLG